MSNTSNTFVKGIYKCLNNFASYYISLMYSSLSNIYSLVDS